MNVDENGNEIPQADNVDSTTTTTGDNASDTSDTTVDTDTTTTDVVNPDEIEDDSTLTDEQKQKLPRAVRERIAERKKRQAAEAERDYWKNQATESAKGTKTDTAAQAGPKELKPEDFETWEKYQEALVDQKVDKKVSEKLDTALKTKTFNEKIAETAKTKPEVLQALNDKTLTPYVTPVMAQAIRESDNPGELILHLKNNPNELFKIANMSPMQAIKEMGRIEDKIAGPPQRVTRTISQAPEPTKPVTGRGAPNADDSKLNDDDWFARERNKRLESAGSRRK